MKKCKLREQKEAHILKLDMSNLDVKKIYNNIPKVNYKVKDSDSEYKKLLEVDKNEKATKKTKETTKKVNKKEKEEVK